MAVPQKILALDGVIQPYAWGGFEFLADLIGKHQSKGEPWAEWWLGAHPKGSAKTAVGTLDKVISDRPAEVLSKEVKELFGGKLPFLLKVLDVQDMLSIQVHPTIEMARSGFVKEEQAGIDRGAPNRNYRDQNHKPELAVALTDFYLLHGFKSEDEIEKALHRESAWVELQEVFSRLGAKGVYMRIMRANEEELEQWLKPLELRLKPPCRFEKSDPDHWAQRAFERYGYDRGIFSIYFFNLVQLVPGEGIFQAARIPHAYLSGACVELMANSDNVLRGGLTPKHVDTRELIKTIDFSSVRPEIRLGKKQANGWEVFETPAPDFRLFRAELPAGKMIQLPEGPAILMVYTGEVSVKYRHSGEVFHKDFRRGQACWLAYGHGAEIHFLNDAKVYVASVGAS
ncbi:MAG: mannose-6-phosphate isomerase, class I [Bacteroidota bacterium]